MNKYICGFTFIDENFLFFEFDEDKANKDEPCKPHYSVYSEDNKLLFRDSIKSTDLWSKFKGIHYKTSTLKSHESNGEWILYNPEAVFKVEPVTLKERVLFLLTKRRIEECVQLVDQYEVSLQLDIKKKVRGAHLDELLKDKKYQEASRLLSKYWGEDISQWEHWIRRFKQKKALGYVTVHIPVGNPIRLGEDIYFLVIKEFLKYKDFGNLMLWVENFKPHLLNYDRVYNLINDAFENNIEVINNSLFFKTFQKIFEYTNNKQGLFLMFIKLNNIRVFDIINDDDVQVDIQNVIELLNISPIKTVAFFVGENKDKSADTVDRIVAYLSSHPHGNKHLHVFLHHLMQKDRLLSLPYNHMQPKLYIEYNPELLLDFLK